MSRRERQPVLVFPGRRRYVIASTGGFLSFPKEAQLFQTPLAHRRELFRDFLACYRPKPGDVIVDVGAGIGEHINVLARMVGETGRVVCIEAQPTTFRHLVGTVQLNRLRKVSHVTLLNLAVTEMPGTVQLSLTGPYQARGLVAGPGVDIESDSLDNILRNLVKGPIDFLKMNIEGAERLAIRGMDETLKRTQNIVIACHDWLVETAGANPDDVCSFDEVSARLRREGFELHSRDDDLDPAVRYTICGVRPKVAEL